MKTHSDNMHAKEQSRNGLRLAAALLCCALLAVGNCAEAEAKTAYDSIAGKEEWEVVKLVNRQRYKGGKEGLSIFSKLQSAADVRAKEIRSVFSHDRPNGSNCFTVLDHKNIFYMSAAENIAAGQATPAAVMEAWMNSPGHRSNIMSETYSFDHIGVGYVTGGEYKKNWTQFFIGGCWTTAIRVNKVSDATYEVGTSIDDMNRFLIITCQEHGTSYMPITAAMCRGYSETKTGVQTVKVTYHDLTATFTVNIKGNGDVIEKPAKVKALTVKKSSATKIKLSFKKVDCDGYQIYMKTGSGSYKKIATIKKSKTVTYTVKGLKKNKTYSLKVRAYRSSDDGKVYGSFSAAKSVRL